ncbi:MAG: hypothetical protein KDH94_02745 [Coxiellaceae bacterium]|nr:hypothetical protein [Coxiellaceae bacterium]
MKKEVVDWFRDCILQPTPVVGAFFHDEDWADRLHRVGRASASMFLGSLIMLLNPAGKSMEDSFSVAYGKVVANMFIGMGAAAIGYSVAGNLARRVGSSLYGLYRARNPESNPLLRGSVQDQSTTDGFGYDSA